MSEQPGYVARYHRAEVLDRWANIYGGKSAMADWSRFAAAGIRLNAEIIKAARIEEMEAWLEPRLARLERRRDRST